MFIILFYFYFQYHIIILNILKTYFYKNIYLEMKLLIMAQRLKIKLHENIGIKYNNNILFSCIVH